MDTATKAHGFWEDRIGGAEAPRRIVMADREFGTPQRSKDGSAWLVTQETVREFPDLWTGPSLTQLTKVSDANPQQSNYRWADAELVSCAASTDAAGRACSTSRTASTRRGRPYVVYFDEEHSAPHAYVAPAGATS